MGCRWLKLFAIKSAREHYPVAMKKLSIVGRLWIKLFAMKAAREHYPVAILARTVAVNHARGYAIRFYFEIKFIPFFKFIF